MFKAAFEATMGIMLAILLVVLSPLWLVLLVGAFQYVFKASL